MHPGPWGPYDFAAAYPAYPPTSGDPQRSPSYGHAIHVSSPNEHVSGTPHNIRDILGAQQGGTLPSEIAKTPSGYQRSPTSTAAQFTQIGGEHHVRSPTTPTTPQLPAAKPFEGVIYSEVPGSFYVPALPRLPGKLLECICMCLRGCSGPLSDPEAISMNCFKHNRAVIINIAPLYNTLWSITKVVKCIPSVCACV